MILDAVKYFKLIEQGYNKQFRFKNLKNVDVFDKLRYRKNFGVDKDHNDGNVIENSDNKNSCRFECIINKYMKIYLKILYHTHNRRNSRA